MFTTETLKFIKSRLPKGSKLKIQKSTGFTLSYINMVLNGERTNEKIIDQAISLIEQAAEADQSVYDRLNKVAAPVRKLA